MKLKSPQRLKHKLQETWNQFSVNEEHMTNKRRQPILSSYSDVITTTAPRHKLNYSLHWEATQYDLGHTSLPPLCEAPKALRLQFENFCSTNLAYLRYK